MQVDQTTIQGGTLLLAIATFFGAMVGSLVQVLLQWREKRNRKRNLRLALIAELEASQQFTTTTPPSHAGLIRGLESAPTMVFDENVDKIGELSSSEVTTILLYYSNMKPSADMISYLDDNIGSLDDGIQKLEKRSKETAADTEELQEELQELIDERQEIEEESIEETLGYLDQERKKALRELRANI